MNPRQLLEQARGAAKSVDWPESPVWDSRDAVSGRGGFGRRGEAEAAIAPGSTFAEVSKQLTLAMMAWKKDLFGDGAA